MRCRLKFKIRPPNVCCSSVSQNNPLLFASRSLAWFWMGSFHLSGWGPKPPNNKTHLGMCGNWGPKMLIIRGFPAKQSETGILRKHPHPLGAFDSPDFLCSRGQAGSEAGRGHAAREQGRGAAEVSQNGAARSGWSFKGNRKGTNQKEYGGWVFPQNREPVNMGSCFLVSLLHNPWLT